MHHFQPALVQKQGVKLHLALITLLRGVQYLQFLPVDRTDGKFFSGHSRFSGIEPGAEQVFAKAARKEGGVSRAHQFLGGLGESLPTQKTPTALGFLEVASAGT